jgi:hypothetical protein
VLHDSSPTAFVTNAAPMFCGRDETVEHVFWRCPTAKTFWAWFYDEFNYFYFLGNSSLEDTLIFRDNCKSNSSLEDTLTLWMFKDNCKSLWHIVWLFTVEFLCIMMNLIIFYFLFFLGHFGCLKTTTNLYGI